MKDMETKQNILQEIMDLMDEREGDSLKKHPKLMAAKVEIEKPEAEEMSAMGEKSEEMPEDGEVSEEMLQKLIEHFKSAK